MNRFFLLVCITGLIAVVGFGSVANSSNLFGIDLYKMLVKKPGNMFISPFSISSALAMTYIGANGNTALQMKKTLYFDLDDESLHTGFSQLIESLNQPNDNYKLAVANSLWAQEDYIFLKEFLEQVQKYYQAGLNYVDFKRETEKARQQINKWVEEKTNGKIKEIIQPDDIDQLTRLILVNAIYFKGMWLKPFDPSLTRKAPFYITKDKSVEVDMMFKNTTTNYTEDQSAQVLELPYAGEKISMIIVLPKKSLDQLEKDLSLDLLKGWIKNFKQEEVDIYLPKFKIEYRTYLKEPLMSMKMVDAFTDAAADFSKMDGTRTLKIHDVIHQSFIEVNEEGTEAAAATAVIIVGKGLSMSKVFKADKPFIFFIYDKTNDLILFMGRLVDPKI